MAEILPIGTTITTSSDVAVADGATLTVCLKDAAGPVIAAGARVDIRLKADNDQYYLVDALTAARPALVLTAKGTYQFARVASVSCGVFSA